MTVTFTNSPVNDRKRGQRVGPSSSSAKMTSTLLPSRRSTSNMVHCIELVGRERMRLCSRSRCTSSGVAVGNKGDMRNEVACQCKPAEPQ